MIYNHWPAWFRALASHDGRWPTSYCAVDVETTGFSFSEDLVTEWGHCLVEDGEVVDRLSLVVNWLDRDRPPDWWVRRRLDQLKQGMELRGAACHMSAARMEKDGEPPAKAFAFIQKFVAAIRDKGIPFVLHNGHFDEKMLAANVIGFGFGGGLSFGDRYIDTAALEKATQRPDHERMHPRTADTLRTYFTRVAHAQIKGLTCNLDNHCFTKYRLDELGVDRKDMHGAYTDAYCCHLLMTRFGALVTDAPAPAAVYPPAAPPTPKPKAARPAASTAAAAKSRVRGQRRS